MTKIGMGLTPTLGGPLWRPVNPLVTGNELLTNPGFEAGFSGGLATGWTAFATGQTFAQEQTTIHGGASAQKVTCVDDAKTIGVDQALTLPVNYFYRVSAWYYGNSARPTSVGLLNTTIGVPALITASVGAAWTQIILNCLGLGASGSHRFYQAAANCAPTDYLIIDDVSAKQLSWPSLISVRKYPYADVTIEATVSRTTGSQVGLVVNCDNPNDPKNFILAYLLGVTGTAGGEYLYVDEWVNGVRANKLAVTTGTYVANKVIKVIRNGTALDFYYNGALLGSPTMTANAGTYHGVFKTGAIAGNSATGVVVAPT